MFPQVIYPYEKLGGEEADTSCPYPTGAIIRFICGVLGKVFQVLSLGGEPEEGRLELDAGDA